MKMFLDTLLNCHVPQLQKDLTMTLVQDKKPPHFCFCWSIYPFCQKQYAAENNLLSCGIGCLHRSHYFLAHQHHSDWRSKTLSCVWLYVYYTIRFVVRRSKILYSLGFHPVSYCVAGHEHLDACAPSWFPGTICRDDMELLPYLRHLYQDGWARTPCFLRFTSTTGNTPQRRICPKPSWTVDQLLQGVNEITKEPVFWRPMKKSIFNESAHRSVTTQTVRHRCTSIPQIHW
jgi:hypothetical protein